MAEQHTPPDRDVLTFEVVQAAWEQSAGELQPVAVLFGWAEGPPGDTEPASVLLGGEVTWP